MKVAAQEATEWQRKISIGYSDAGGNTEKSSGSVDLMINRKSPDDELTIKANGYIGRTDKKTDAKKFYGMGRYANSFGESKKWYRFGKVEGSQDKFANIDYRITPSYGLGYWFADQDDFKAKAEMAVGYEFTSYSDTTDDEGEAVLVPSGYLEKKLIGDLRFSQEVTVYPSLEEISEYRLHLETSLTNPINDQMSWKVSLLDDYDSAPKGDVKNNDYRLISAIDISF